MFSIKLADVPIAIEAQYPLIENLCEDYKISLPCNQCMLFVSVNNIEIARENDSNSSFPLAYCEALALYRKICLQMINYDTFLFHSAVLEYNGRSYAFSAKSGTGKSTHIKQWKRALKEGVNIINGDKPLIRYINNQFIVYGTPFMGKENWGSNLNAPLQAICFIERSETDQLERIVDNDEIISRILQQILLPSNPELITKLLQLIDKLIMQIPFYILHCTPSLNAHYVAFEITQFDNTLPSE